MSMENKIFCLLVHFFIHLCGYTVGLMKFLNFEKAII